MLHYGFPIYTGNDPLDFASEFSRVINKVQHNQIASPYFLIFLHEHYNRGIFYSAMKTQKYTNSVGEEKTDPVHYAYTFESASACSIPKTIIDHPQAYLASYYTENGRLNSARVAFKSIMQAIRNKIETVGPITTQSGYIFTTTRISPRKINVHLEIAATPSNIADPYWLKSFAMANSHCFDVTQIGAQNILASIDGNITVDLEQT